MKKEQTVTFRLPSGCNVELSEKVHDEIFANYDESKYFSFNNIINSGLYFPQIMQFATVMYYICSGHTSFKEIFLCNLIMGIGYTLLWYICKLYKTPGINFISCLIGGNFFRFFLHFIPIIIVAIFVVKKWEIIIYCVIGGLITQLIKSFLFVRFSNVKYNDEVATYVSKLKK